MARTSVAISVTDTEEFRQFAERVCLFVTAVRELRNEVDCRIEHGAESGGHLEYVRSKLDDLLVPLAE